MKVKIMQRSVYYKYAEVEIEIPNDWKNKDDVENHHENLNYYLIDNSNLWHDKLQEALDEANIDYGFGMHTGHWTEYNEDFEQRYELEDGYGGHL